MKPIGVFEEKLKSLDSSSLEAIFGQLTILCRASGNHLIKLIPNFINYIEKNKLSTQLSCPQLASLWQSLILKHGAMLNESKICERPPSPHTAHTLFQQLQGLYLYTMSQTTDDKSIASRLRWQAAACGNFEAAKVVVKHCIKQLMEGSISEEKMGQVLFKAEKCLIPFQTVGYLLLGQLWTSAGGCILEQNDRDTLNNGWARICGAIMSFYVADKLKATPTSIFFMQDGYGVKTLDEVWQCNDSPLLLNTDPEKDSFPTLDSYINVLKESYEKGAWSREDLLAKRAKIFEEVDNNLAKTAAIVLPKSSPLPTPETLKELLKFCFSDNPSKNPLNPSK